MFANLLNRKAVILALGFTFTICFFLSIFVNGSTTTKSFNEHQWFYINRGYPVAWAGVSLNNKAIELPLIKAPFITKDEFSKVIDLRIFLPLFLVTFLASYIPAFILAKAVEENKKLFPSFVALNVLVLLCGIFVYFFWFPRI